MCFIDTIVFYKVLKENRDSRFGILPEIYCIYIHSLVLWWYKLELFQFAAD